MPSHFDLRLISIFRSALSYSAHRFVWFYCHFLGFRNKHTLASDAWWLPLTPLFFYLFPSRLTSTTGSWMQMDKRRHVFTEEDVNCDTTTCRSALESPNVLDDFLPFMRLNSSCLWFCPTSICSFWIPKSKFLLWISLELDSAFYNPRTMSTLNTDSKTNRKSHSGHIY